MTCRKRAIGLALQGTLSNIASGVMILILRPFNVGDYISFGPEGGTVNTLGLFGTEISTADNIYLYAPNSKIWGTEIRNYSRNKLRRQDIKIRVSHHEDIGRVMVAINEALNSDARILQQEEDKKPEILADSIDDFAMNLTARFWSRNEDTWPLNDAINKAIKKQFDIHKIIMPARGVEMIASAPDGSHSAQQGTK